MLKYIAVISENIFDKYVFWDNTFYEYKTSYNKKRIYLPIDKEETATILNLKDIDFDSTVKSVKQHFLESMVQIAIEELVKRGRFDESLKLEKYFIFVAR